MYDFTVVIFSFFSITAQDTKSAISLTCSGQLNVDFLSFSKFLKHVSPAECWLQVFEENAAAIRFVVFSLKFPIKF